MASNAKKLAIHNLKEKLGVRKKTGADDISQVNNL